MSVDAAHTVPNAACFSIRNISRHLRSVTFREAGWAKTCRQERQTVPGGNVSGASKHGAKRCRDESRHGTHECVRHVEPATCAVRPGKWRHGTWRTCATVSELHTCCCGDAKSNSGGEGSNLIP